MIQVYKHNNLYIIVDTISDSIYPNLTRKEASAVLRSYGRTVKDRLGKGAQPFSCFIEDNIYDKDVYKVLKEINIKNLH